MASRVKTIEFATQTNTVTLASGTARSITGSTSIFIPETGGTFAFKSVILQVECTEDNNTSTTLTSPTIGFRLGTTPSFNSAVGVNPVVNSGRNQAWTFTRDITSVIASQWSGTTNALYLLLIFSGPVTTNHSAKIIITYQYDDTFSPNSQIKTIRIPIESTRTLLTSSFLSVGGTNAIPNIGLTTNGYLPETGITIRQVFVELWSNCGTLGANTTYTLQTRFNGGTAINTWRYPTSASGVRSGVWSRSIIDITSQGFLTGTTTIECTTTVTNRFCTIGGMIVVTYEFNPSTSTTIYNSLMIGSVDTSGWIGGTTTANQGIWERNIYIEEPDTIILKESALALYQNDSAGYSFLISVSGDTALQTTYQTYVMTAADVQAGTYSLVHRIDAGGQNGAAGISLKRGKNLYRVRFYSNTAQAGWNLSGFMLLNYTSGKHSSGVGVHAHSVYQHITDNITAGGSQVNTSVNTITPTIPETDYYLIGFLFWVNYSCMGGPPAVDMFYNVDAEVNSGETVQGGDGWVSLYNGSTRTDSVNMNGYIYAAASSNFTRWNSDPDPDRLNIKNGRKYRFSCGPTWTGSMGYWYTYNNITYVVSGTCSGFSGDGSGIPIDIYRVISNTQDEMILNTTTSIGGGFSVNWIDNTDTLFAAARQDDTHVGRSRNGKAGS